MVCLGNICRSPMAEGILQHKIEQHHLPWQVDSAGTGGWHIGEAPHKKTQKICKKHGIDVSHQSARQFIQADMQFFDKIYVMDMENYTDVKRIAGNLWNESKVDLILNASQPNQDSSVPDPWFDNTDEAFERVYQMLDKACDKIIVNNYQ